MPSARVGSAALLILVVGTGIGGCTDAMPDGGASSSLRIGELSTYPNLTVEANQPLAFGAPAAVDPSEAVWSEAVSWWDDDHPDTSFGVNLCVSRGATLRIDRLEPLVQIGSDVEVLGAIVISLDPQEDSVISASGYPPTDMGRRALEEVGPALFSYTCGSRPIAQQLLVGLRGVGPTGGGWLGVTVHYRDDQDRSYQLTVPVSMMMCGTATAPCGDEQLS